MQTLIIVAALGPIHALETLHALLDNHPRGLRNVFLFKFFAIYQIRVLDITENFGCKK